MSVLSDSLGAFLASAQLLELTQLCASSCKGGLAANRSSLAMHDLASLRLLRISSVRLLCQMSSAALVAARNVLRQSVAVRMFGPSSMRIQQACRHHNMRLLDTSFLWC